MDDEQRYAAAASRDARFDGVFFIAVLTTGIYCRPSCPALTPKRCNVRFLQTAAAAQRAGFRACKRCRPDASPGSPEWNVRADVAARAMRLIADGVVDRAGVSGLAASLGYSVRQVSRLLTAELGAGPLALARAQRARTARVLVETTALPLGDIAFAAGFSSIRQFNATMLEVYDTPPSLLRERAARTASTGPAAPGVLRLRLPFRPPIDLPRLFRFLAARAIPGVEMVSPSEYKRTISLPNGWGILCLRIAGESRWVDCELVLSDLRDVTAAVQRARRLLDLDADPLAISEYLGTDPTLAPLVRACPGRRSAGAVSGDEIALRAVLGQQVSVAAARRLGGVLTELCGARLPAFAAGSAPGPDSGDGAGLTRLFPDAAAVAGLDPDSLPMPRARARALAGLAAALASGTVSLHPGADREEAEARLLELPGIGPWTAAYIRMRALADPDVFVPGDAGIAAAVKTLGQPWPPGRDGARGWRPWRSYAVHHLWAAIEPPAGNGQPTAGNGRPTAGNGRPTAGNGRPTAGNGRPTAGSPAGASGRGPVRHGSSPGPANRDKMGTAGATSNAKTISNAKTGYGWAAAPRTSKGLDR